MSTPTDRTLSARVAAATRWAMTADRTAATAPARQGLRAKFAKQIDPDGILPAADLEHRVDQLMRAHMLRMALASKQARAARSAGSSTASGPSAPATGTDS